MNNFISAVSSSLLKKSQASARQGKNASCASPGKTGVYTTVHENFEPIFNAVSCRLRHFQQAARVFAVSVLIIGGVTAAPTETDSRLAGQASQEELVASYRKANPAAHRGRPVMTHEPKGNKSRRTLPAVAGSGGRKHGASLPSGKKKLDI